MIKGAVELDKKFHNLKRTYNKIKQCNNKSGRGIWEWKYYTEMEAVFGMDLEFNVTMLESITKPTNRNITEKDNVGVEQMELESTPK